MPEKKIGPQDALERDIQAQIERNRSLYERAPEGSLETIEGTTLPWVVRMEIRNTLFAGFIDPPPGLGDNWGLQRTYNTLGDRARYLSRITYPAEAKVALGFVQEPWRDVSVIPKQHKQEFMEKATSVGRMTPTSALGLFNELEREAKERVPWLSKELLRSQDELSTIRRVIYLWWAWRNAASGQEVGQTYLDSKIPVLPRFDDFQKIFALPATFMTPDEVGDCPGYPKETQVIAVLGPEKLNKERRAGTFGELVQREARLMNLVTLADQPEEIIKWKLQAETKALHNILEAHGVNPVYLFLKRKGIPYSDPGEERKIAEVIAGLTPQDKEKVQNAFWQQFGYKNAGEAKEMIGDFEMWIPLEARRGNPEPVGDSTPFLEVDRRSGREFTRRERVEAIQRELEGLKEDWEKLSPLNNPSFSEEEAVRRSITKRIDSIRLLSTSQIEIEEDGEKKLKVVNIIPSLQLENELGLRGEATKEGCVWARPQMAKDKVGVMDSAFLEFVGGNRLAYEEALAIVGMMGFPAKWGYYARDYDPTKHDPKRPGYSPGEWQVDVEAWPYTSEMQNILAFPWHQQYKEEAAGPDASRGRFGPLMTDYLSAYPVKRYDQYNNESFVVIDKDGNLKYGRADEGVIIADTAVTLLEYWHSGGNLANPEPWGKIIEDPYRRFLLRGFFALGRAVLGPGGNELLGLWKRRDWKLEDLDSDAFWDAYKLARRVALREEFFDEDVWSDVVAPIDAKYRQEAAACLSAIKTAILEPERRKIMEKYGKLYRQWRKDRKDAVFDYSDKTFGEGLLSTQMINLAYKLYHSQKMGEYKIENPKTVVSRILEIAKKRDINLGWNINKIFSVLDSS